LAEKKTKKAKKTEKKKTQKKTKADDNVIFVGRKPTMSYVLAVITQFSDGVKEVNIKARGRSISRAVDVAEVVKNKFLDDVKVKSIDIGTEEREVEGGNKINVSTMSILLSK
jgi:DNA-binding protein Alba